MNTKEYNNCVNQLSDSLFAYAYRIIKQRQEAEDIIQRTYEKLWTLKDKVETEQAKSYLYKMVYNTCMDFYRMKQHQQNYLNSLSLSTHSPSIEKSLSIKDSINNALEQLPDTYRALVLLRDNEGYSYKEIGKITELSESQVKVYIFRARKELQTHLSHLRNY